jgi:hypothetical protein
LEDLVAANAEGMLQALGDSRAEAIERDTEAGNFYFGYDVLLLDRMVKCTEE